MIRWRKGRVDGVRREWPGAIELDVTIIPHTGAGRGGSAEIAGSASSAAATTAEGIAAAMTGPPPGPAPGSAAGSTAGPEPGPAPESAAGSAPEPEPESAPEEVRCRALAYPALVGRPEPGDTVLLNTTALALGLGTGGYAMVVALPDRLPPDPSGPGHLVKARYTPLQATVLGADEQDSPHHDLLRDADDLTGLPVIVADLHSALAPILAGLLARRPGTRVVYLMPDGGALPAWFSMSIARLKSAGAITATVTVGQAFGGDLEAVTVHTGLLAARLVLDAEVVILAQGPGNLGTGTKWGFSGVSAGEAVNAAAVLSGRPIASLRVSEGDARERHLGVSHHSLTAYGRVALARADVPVPQLPGEFGARVAGQAAELAGRHTLVPVPVDGLTDELRAFEQESGVRMSTMGRRLDRDPAYFLTTGAAGRYAADVLSCGAGLPSGA